VRSFSILLTILFLVAAPGMSAELFRYWGAASSSGGIKIAD